MLNIGSSCRDRGIQGIQYQAGRLVDRSTPPQTHVSVVFVQLKNGVLSSVYINVYRADKINPLSSGHIGQGFYEYSSHEDPDQRTS